MPLLLHPSLYQINTRVSLTELARGLGRPATLDDFADATLDRIAGLGFHWVWLLGVWQTGPRGRAVSLRHQEWRAEFQRTLPDFSDADVSGSPFAIQEYRVDRRLGGAAALERIRQRLAQRGLRLMLDFVPNHTAPDHPWVQHHPEYYVQGNDGDLHREPQNYCRLDTASGARVFAFGRDPYFPGWPDTVQLNYQHAGMRAALRSELLSIANQCDGLRCDMAMLVLPNIFRRTWGDRARPCDGTPPTDAPFWPDAIGGVRQRHPSFLFLAEVYWNLEWVLQQQGFDYTYDKRLYDRLESRDGGAVGGHLHADLAFQNHSARFLENHDEPRAAATFPPDVHKAAAVIAFLVPGLRFLHDGQLEGRKVRVSMHLDRRPDEPVDTALAQFYQRLLECVRLPVANSGRWRYLECRSAWEGNSTWQNFIAFGWNGPDSFPLLIAVNYGPMQGQCYVRVAFSGLSGRRFELRDRMGPARYERNGSDMENGLYLDMPAWGHHVFELVRKD
jgi:hypothetical protein